MASIAVNGDTSGSITLSAPAVAGTTTLTLPAVSGGVLNDANCGVCRAWVNFNGTGTVAIRASFNVSSIADNGVGDYTVNMTNALVDSSYSVSGVCNGGGTSGLVVQINSATAGSLPTLKSTTQVRFTTSNTSASTDTTDINVAIFR